MTLDFIGLQSNESLTDLSLHLNAGLWSFLLIVFGYVVIMMDTRARKKKKQRQSIRDRILGIEQRYFIVIFNGILLYFTLIILLSRKTTNNTVKLETQ